MSEPPSPPASQPRSLAASGILCLATGLGFGFSPVAPGTVGALWGLPLAWLIAKLATWQQICLIMGLCFVGVPICTSAAKQLGRKDPKEVVWDEVVTVPITFLLVEARLIGRPEVLLIGFVLHRIFDITKPPPARNLERLPDGAGIVADDVVAAVYSCLALHALLWLWPWLAR